MVRRIGVLTAIACAAVLLAGCAQAISAPQLVPKLSPPVIVRPGLLKAVVDTSYPPFGGVVDGHRVGLDCDVAAAIADDLGLKLDLIDAAPGTSANLLHEGRADIVLGALTVQSAVASDVAFAGTYVTDAPVLYSTKAGKVGLADLGGKKIAAQSGSQAYWLLTQAYGPDAVIGEATLRQALSAAASGTVDYAAGDAIVAAYIVSRDMPTLKYDGQIAPSFPLGVGVSSEKPKMQEEVRDILDKFAAEGVLDTLRHKWVGDLPALQAPSFDASVSVDASPTP
jgi:polar amino acid transport system substrate-binding protein